MNKRHLVSMAITASVFLGTAAQAVTFDIKITNLTHGMAFGHIVVAAHAEGNGVFAPGQAASPFLKKLAEDNDTTDLQTAHGSTATLRVVTPTGNYLLPGASVDSLGIAVTDPSYTHFSVVSMMVPTNDAFAGLNTISIPTTAGRYVYNLSAYDAGTEANNELFGTPGMFYDAAFEPGTVKHTGTGGSNGFSMDNNTTVHVHRNVVGDDNPTGGISDLKNTVHRWLNPVMRVIVTVQ